MGLPIFSNFITQNHLGISHQEAAAYPATFLLLALKVRALSPLFPTVLLLKDNHKFRSFTNFTHDRDRAAHGFDMIFGKVQSDTFGI